jgi:hypothetical protein
MEEVGEEERRWRGGYHKEHIYAIMIMRLNKRRR